MHYKIPNLKTDIEDVSKFLKEMGEEGIEALPKLKVSVKDLPGKDEEMKIITLSP
jgi:hypothetical protein